MIKLVRIDQWRATLLRERKTASLLAMLAALASGPVDRLTWRRRIQRGCMQCPIYNRERKVCRSPFPAYSHLGCGCYVPFLAMTRRPYKGGCWGRMMMGAPFGWGDELDDPPIV